MITLWTSLYTDAEILIPDQEPNTKKENGEKVEPEIPPLYFINLKLIIPGCNEAVPIQVSIYMCISNIIKCDVLTVKLLVQCK